MLTVTSKDGTTIAYERAGNGPLVIAVAGALQYRAFDQGTKAMAALLAPHFTMIEYDRRGRGDSTDTPPFAVQREIEDVEALIDQHGGSAYLYGMSSGAALAFEMALALGSKVKKLAMYEAPYNDEAGWSQTWGTYRKTLAQLTAEGKSGDAVLLFMKLVGMPDDHAAGMRQHPMWPLFEAVGRTLVYDAAAMGDESAVPLEKAARLMVPALVMDGSASYPFMHTTAVALAKAMPHGEHRTLEGQTHEVDPKVLAKELDAFFSR